MTLCIWEVRGAPEPEVAWPVASACDSVLLSSSKSKIGRFVQQVLADLASECNKIRNGTLQGIIIVDDI